MRKIMLMLCLAAFVLCSLSTTILAYEVTTDDISGVPTGKTTVKSPPNPGLVGFFVSKESEVFAYALIEKDGQYSMFVKIRGKYEGWADATIDGDVIVFGKKGMAKIIIDDNNEVYRLFDKQKTPLAKVE